MKKQLPSYIENISISDIKERADYLYESLSSCTLCPNKCRTNRHEKQSLICKCDDNIRIAHYSIHFGEEPPISGRNGSGTIFFAGCTAGCVFCQNYQISQPDDIAVFNSYSIKELSEIMHHLQKKGAHNINLVSPAPYIPHILMSLPDAIKSGLNIPLVFNSGGYENPKVIKMLDGIVDIYLPDLKYIDNTIATELSNIKGYSENAIASIGEMISQTGSPAFDESDLLIKGTIIRHLVIPGYIDNSRDVLNFISKEFGSKALVSIMAQYNPVHRACEHPEINRLLSQKEYDEIVDFVCDIDLENGFIQELESHEKGLPDFSRKKVFHWEDD